MRFEHAPAAHYGDFASGDVLYSAPGHPGFPVRLTLELFERARLLTGRSRVGVWDPMCGAGGIVTTLGLARGEAITQILATDISGDATTLAAKNLELLTDEGLRRRARLLAKRSDARAEVVERLRERRRGASPITTHVSVLDVTRTIDVGLLPLGGIDIVIADLPYGGQTAWSSGAQHPPLQMLQHLRAHLSRHSVIVLCSNRRMDFAELPGSLRTFKHGKRIIKFYRGDAS
ncbi:rRNA methyltransferase [Georgenia faecalis]|uniref:rRNA methyltransferase n=1 Tax=Georgenia faecalis TaxID=2483799 RepID=UPI000FDB7001|nr:rRNA methyltransferase [Georgenia faecalis]